MKAAPRKQKTKAAPVQPPAKTAAPPVPPASAAARVPWKRHALLLAGLCFVALLAWSNSFSSGFVFDNRVIVQDARIKAVTPQNIDQILNQEFWYPWSVTGLYRPLTTFSFLFNYAIVGNGANPAGWHWLNFLLHAINIALVYALALLLLDDLAPAFALAAVWALHPILTESVTNIVGRADLLAAFGVLAGLLCHIRAASAAGWRKFAWLAGLALAVAIGLFSKESTVVVLGVMLLYDLAFPTAPWRARAAGYAALALPIAFFFAVRNDVLSRLPTVHVAFGDNPLVGTDFWTARFTAVKVIGKYLWRLLWPLALSADYSYNQIPLVTWHFQSWEDWKAPLALAVCLAAGAVALRCRRSARPLFFFILFFFVTLAPTANIFLLIGTIMAERFLYLPSIAFAGCLVLAVYAVCRRLPLTGPTARYAAPALLALIAIAFGARTYARNFDWHDEKTLWTSGVRVSPASFKTHGSLAAALNDGTAAGLDRAIREMDRSLAILQGLPDEKNVAASFVNAGSYFRQKGDLLAARKPDGTIVATPASLPWYRKSLDTLMVAERLSRASNAEARREDLASGQERLFEYGMYPLDAELGHTYVRLGDYTNALKAFERGRAHRADPQFFIDIAGVWRAAGDLHKAAVTLMEGLIVDTGYTKFAAGLVELYRQIDPKGCALRPMGSGVTLNLECPQVHEDVCAASRNVAQAYRQGGQPEAAGRTVQTAITQLGCPAGAFQ